MNYILTNLDILNFFIMAMGVGVAILGITIIFNSSMTKESKKYFSLFLLFLILYIGPHMIRMVIVGHPGTAMRVALNLVVFCEYFATAFMPTMIILLINNIAFDQQQSSRFIRWYLWIVISVHCILTVVAHFTHLYYYFDESNIYHRSSLYILSNVTVFLIILQGIAVLIHYRNKFRPDVYVALWLYMIAPLIGMILQSVYSGVKWIVFATVMASAYMFVVITSDFNKKYVTQSMEKSRIESELTLATRIQESMLPSLFPAFPERPEFDLYASMNPAKEVGGDFYDFFMVDEDHLALIIADVSGKGIPGAMFMMFSKNIIANNVMLGKNPAKALADANAAICKNNAEDMFVTVWLGILEISTGKLTCSNGGHEYPFFKQNGEFARYKDEHGFSVGWFEDSEYTEYEIKLSPGDRIFVYTDGVPEATNGSGDMYGTERTLAVLNRDRDASCEKLLKDIWEDVGVFVGEAEQFDDLTMLALEYRG